MSNHNQNPYTRVFKAAGYSYKGLISAFKNEQALRQEVYVLILLVPAAFYYGKNGVEYSLLIGSWLLVIVTELLNSSIEATVDRVGMERHELAGRAKDMGSAAVFVAIVIAMFVWFAIFLFD